MYRILRALMTPENYYRAAFNVIVLLMPLNVFAYFVESTLFATGPVTLLNVSMRTTIIALPFMVAAQIVGAHQGILHRKMKIMALTDPLTNLLNRRAFFDRVGGILMAESGALVLIDADHFKRINDTFGHTGGDHCLRMLAAQIRASIRHSDLAARVGGEEFAIFLPGTTVDQAHLVAERICHGMTVFLPSGTEQLKLTTSAGVASAMQGDPLDIAMAAADQALYAAKNAGRARAEIA